MKAHRIKELAARTATKLTATMRRTRRLAAVAAIGAAMLSGQAAYAAVTLPANALEFRFDAITAFDLSYDPFIDVTNGNLIAPAPADGPLQLTAFGEVETIFDAADSNNKGSISGELTFAYTGGTLSPLGAPALIGATATTRTYAITSTISGGTLTYYHDPLTGGTLDLNTAAHFGAPNAIPAAATDGTPYLVATTPDDTVAAIVITFFRPNALANFNRYTISLQVANGGNFPVLGGDILLDHPNIQGTAVLASQLGPYSTNFQTEVVDGVLRNKSVNRLIEGSFEARVLIPEPASLALLGLGAVVILGRRRKSA